MVKYKSMIDSTTYVVIVCMSCAGSTPLWGFPKDILLIISQVFSTFTSRLTGWVRYDRYVRGTYGMYIYI